MRISDWSSDVCSSDLTDRLPDSQITGDAHFRRGELLFVRTRYAEAETEYHTVMALKDATPFFEQAQYTYGWSQYKKAKYEEANGTFCDILDRELPLSQTTDPEKTEKAPGQEKEGK